MLAPVPKKRRDGKTSFKSLGSYLTKETDKETGQVIERGPVMISPALLSRETAELEMRATAKENARCKDPVLHLVLSWDRGETPTREQWEQAVTHTMDALKFRDHQYMAVAHNDTENYHVHIMVNRVHPETGRAHYPEWLHKTLDKSVREIEAAQGWKEGHGLYKWDEEKGRAVPMSPAERAALREASERRALDAGEAGRGRAANMERYSNAESLQTYAKSQPAQDLAEVLKRERATWQDVHEALSRHGLTLHRGEHGGYTVRAETAHGQAIHAKASDVFRRHFSGKAARAATEQKLGEWKPPETEISREEQRDGREQQRDDRGVPADRARMAWRAAARLHQSDHPGHAAPGQARSLASVRNLSMVPLVHHQRVSEMLLSDHAPNRLGRQRAPDSQVRRPRTRDSGSRPEPGVAHPIRRYNPYREPRRDPAQRAERRDERAVQRENLRRRFRDYKAAWFEARARRRPAEQAAATARFAELAKATRERRAAIRAEARTATERKARLSVAAAEAAQAKERLRADLAERRRQDRPQDYRAWVQAQALEGDPAAISQIRGWRYTALRGSRQAQREAEDLERRDRVSAADRDPHDPADPRRVSLAHLTWQVDRATGNVAYRIDGRPAFTDRGRNVTVESQDRKAMEAALRVALEKFGPSITLHGSEAYQARMVDIAVRANLRVEFTNPEQARQYSEGRAAAQAGRDYLDQARRRAQERPEQPKAPARAEPRPAPEQAQEKQTRTPEPEKRRRGPER